MEELKSISSYFQKHFSRNYNLSLENDSLQFSDKFKSLIQNKVLNHNDWFSKEPLLYDASGTPDYLGTAFYMINSLQEFSDSESDHFGRFKYEHSYQHKFNCVNENLVERYLREYVKQQGKELSSIDSKIFLSHDIDRINSGILQDAFSQVKECNFSRLFSLLFKYFTGNRAWRNIDRLLKMETASELKATYFWIANNLKDEANGIANGDYHIQDPYVVNSIKKIEQLEGFTNGLHKSSIASSSLNDELALLGCPSTINRYHYLKFHPKVDYNKLSESAINFDTTLGFAEQMGFRNSYGLPFRPFNLNQNCLFHFLEVPLNIMDTTFLTYQNNTPKQTENQIFEFLEQHSHNAVISILWHNDKATPYKFHDYLDIFKSLIKFIYDNKVETVLPEELIAEYYS